MSRKEVLMQQQQAWVGFVLAASGVEKEEVAALE